MNELEKEKNICIKCGNENINSALYCGYCGNKLIENVDNSISNSEITNINKNDEDKKRGNRLAIIVLILIGYIIMSPSLIKFAFQSDIQFTMLFLNLGIMYLSALISLILAIYGINKYPNNIIFKILKFIIILIVVLFILFLLYGIFNKIINS